MRKQAAVYSILASWFIGTWALPAQNRTSPVPTAKLIDSGKGVYQERCVMCHGSSGEGNGPAGTYLNPKPRNLKADQFKQGDSPEHVYETISEGISASAMPSFSSLSTEELWGLVYYVRSFREKVEVKAPMPPDPQTDKDRTGS